MNKTALMWCVLATVIVVWAEVQVEAQPQGANCNPRGLTSCSSAVMGSQQPSAECCTKLKEQEPCYCGYLSNPTLKQYFDSPEAQKVAAACKIDIPKC